jgi:TonB family protein
VLTLVCVATAHGDEPQPREVTRDAGGHPILVAPTAYGPDVLVLRGYEPAAVMQVDCERRMYREAAEVPRLNQHGNLWLPAEAGSVAAAIVDDHCAAPRPPLSGPVRKLPEFVPPNLKYLLVVCKPDGVCSAVGGPVASCDPERQRPGAIHLEAGEWADCLPLTDGTALAVLGASPDGTAISARPGNSFPQPNDYYPATSMRRREQGAVIVRACVSPDGTLYQAPVVSQTSGSRRLDEGALALARAGSGRYLPALDLHGVPVRSCAEFRVFFFTGS